MFLQVPDALLNVVSFGAGPRTLVAHGGWTGSWELWQQPFERLTAQGWRCISYDHRGTGASVADPASISTARLVDDLFAVVDALAVERCILAGESMGGVLAGLAVARQPARFDGLVLVGSPPGFADQRDSPFVAACRTDWPATAAAFVDRCLPEADSDHLRAWGRKILLRSDAESAARLLEGMDPVALDPAALPLPVLSIHGELDAIVPVEAAHGLAAALPDATLHVLEGAGHVPTVTRSGEVARLIDARFPAGV